MVSKLKISNPMKERLFRKRNPDTLTSLPFRKGQGRVTKKQAMPAFYILIVGRDQLFTLDL